VWSRRSMAFRPSTMADTQQGRETDRRTVRRSSAAVDGLAFGGTAAVAGAVLSRPGAGPSAAVPSAGALDAGEDGGPDDTGSVRRSVKRGAAYDASIRHTSK